MKKGFFKKIAAGVLSGLMCFTMLPKVQSASFAASVGDKLTVQSQGGTTQHKGNCDGYSYEVWIDNTGGSGSMTLGQGASFKAEWSANNASGNFLARRGLDFGSQKKATDYPYIGMDYEADYRQTGSQNGNSRLCVYGWFQNKNAGNVPLVEYYIIEDWVDWCPDGNGKMITIDGAQYKIFQLDHTGPTINGGSETFKQYFSVRQDKRTSGHITVSDHFKAWADQGWGIGNLYEVALNAEGWQSSGVADVKKLDVYTDPSQAGNTDITPPTPVEPDENGHYFHSTFESDEDGWTGRGEASVKVANGGAEGSKSLSVTGRTDTWHGVCKSLNTSIFKPGESYAFSAMAKQDASASEDFKLTLECSVDGEKQYLEVAANTGAKGEWVQLSNPSFTIPAGATGLVLYVETIDTTTSFSVDEMIGGIEGSVKNAEKKAKLGDINGDGKVDSKDLPLLQDYLLKRTAAITEAADMDKDGKLTSFDMVLLRKAVLTPEPEPATEPPTQAPTQSSQGGNKVDPSEFMATVRSNFTTNVPSNVKSGDQGKTEKITYNSKVAGVNKSANVWLPPNYDSSKKYNVLYLNHGVFGNEDSMLTGFSVREMASNLISSGEAEPFIIVFPQMYSGPGGGTPSFAQMNMNTMDNYDKFLQDMTDSLMPYIESHYSVKTGRDNTAIAGFSMGGRETLYLTISRPDLFGYACASSPAPGIVPASDSFIANHLGSYKADGQRMTNADFKIDKDKMPYLVMIGGGTADSVVGTFPESYHNLFTQNGTDHIWQSFPGGGHDGSVGTPMFYNFFKNVFKASK